MDITLSRLTDLVAISLGEYPDWKRAFASEGAGCSLSEMVEVLLMPAAMEAVANLPIEDCTHLIDMRIHIHDSTDRGFENIYPCELPEDFLRLHSFRMPDWPRTCSESNLNDPLRLGLGERAPQWLLERTSRPFLEITPGDGTSPPVIRYGPTQHTSPEVALYVPRPRYDTSATTLRAFQPKALMKLVETISRSVGE